MSRPVFITGVATWTPGGVSIGGPPQVEGQGPGLGTWSEAPKLEAIHPRARRPSALARSVVQLGHGLLAERRRHGDFAPAPTALCVGNMSGCVLADADFADGLAARGEAFGSPSVFVYTLPTTVLGEMAIALGFRGAVETVSAGSASGVSALSVASQAIASGRFESCVAGGIEVATTGARRAFAQTGRDSIVFFLLESQPDAAAYLRLTDWQTGFGEPPPTPEAPGAFLSNSPLLKLAGAAVGRAAGLLACAAPEGFWATLSWEGPT